MDLWHSLYQYQSLNGVLPKLINGVLDKAVTLTKGLVSNCIYSWLLESSQIASTVAVSGIGCGSGPFSKAYRDGGLWHDKVLVDQDAAGPITFSWWWLEVQLNLTLGSEVHSMTKNTCRFLAQF